MNRFRIAVAAVLAVIMLSTCVLDAEAQRWRKRAQIIVPVDPQTPTIALLDSLVDHIEQNDSLRVRLSPDDPQKYTAQEISDLLLEEGLGVTSASHVFISYQFDLNRQGFKEQITNMYFVYRSGATSGEDDIPIMYVNARKSDWFTRLISQKGTTGAHLMDLRTFRDQLAFARVVRNMDAQIVRIGGEPVREGFDRKKRQLVNEITTLTYQQR